MKAFIIINKQLRLYTVMGAEDSVQAVNKATKLWGNNWHVIEAIGDKKFLYPEFVAVNEFTKQIKKFSQATKRETNK